MNMNDIAIDGQRPVRHAPTSRSRPARCRSITATNHAIKDVDVDILDKTVTAFIGPSGCGKSTFLRCLNRMNDTIADLPRRGRRSRSTARTSTTAASTRCSCAPRSAWCSRSRTRSRSRSTTTSPTARASTAWRATRPNSTRSSRHRLRTRRALGRGQGPAARARHRAVGRPAAAPVHRPRHRDRARGAADGRALLGARPDRHRAGRGADRRAARATIRS